MQRAVAVNDGQPKGEEGEDFLEMMFWQEIARDKQQAGLDAAVLAAAGQAGAGNPDDEQQATLAAALVAAATEADT